MSVPSGMGRLALSLHFRIGTFLGPSLPFGSLFLFLFPFRLSFFPPLLLLATHDPIDAFPGFFFPFPLFSGFFSCGCPAALPPLFFACQRCPTINAFQRQFVSDDSPQSWFLVFLALPCTGPPGTLQRRYDADLALRH